MFNSDFWAENISHMKWYDMLKECKCKLEIAEKVLLTPKPPGLHCIEYKTTKQIRQPTSQIRDLP